MIQEIWVIALAVATPIAGVVGFAFQLRNIRKARLETQKLELELALLKQKLDAATKDINIENPTNDQVALLMTGKTIEQIFRSMNTPFEKDIGSNLEVRPVNLPIWHHLVTPAIILSSISITAIILILYYLSV